MPFQGLKMHAVIADCPDAASSRQVTNVAHLGCPEAASLFQVFQRATFATLDVGWHSVVSVVEASQAVLVL